MQDKSNAPQHIGAIKNSNRKEVYSRVEHVAIHDEGRTMPISQ